MIRYNGITIDRDHHVIQHQGKHLRFTRKVRKPRNIRFETACHLLLDAGISKEQLFWHAYGDDPDGGPLDGPHLFSVIINRLAQDFAKISIEIRSWRIASVVFYCAVPRFEISNPRQIIHNSKYVKGQHPPANPSVANVV